MEAHGSHVARVAHKVVGLLRMGRCNVSSGSTSCCWSTIPRTARSPRSQTHTAPLDEAPEMYEKFQKKETGCIKVVLEP